MHMQSTRKFGLMSLFDGLHKVTCLLKRVNIAASLPRWYPFFNHVVSHLHV